MKDKQNRMSNETAMGCGIMLAFGFPAIGWIWFGWKVALTILILGQAAIYIARGLTKK